MAYPVTAMRGRKYVVRTARPHALAASEARHPSDSIDTAIIVGLRDRVLIGSLVIRATVYKSRCLPVFVMPSGLL
jgi:hypothetical protein